MKQNNSSWQEVEDIQRQEKAKCEVKAGPSEW